MAMTINNRQKLKICMLLPPLDIQQRVNPQIEICSYLTNFGYQITWVTSLGKDYPPQQFWLNSSQVKLYDIPYHHYCPGDSLPAKIFNQLANDFSRRRLILDIFRKQRYDLIFVRDGPSNGLTAIYLRKKYHLPLVYELSDPLEQKLDTLGVEHRRLRWLHYRALRFNNWQQLRVMRKADLILTTTRWFEEGLVKKGIAKAKLMAYPNGVDIESFANKKGEDIRQRFGLSSSPVIIYVGAIGRARNLGLLLEAFVRVNQINKEAKLLIVGDYSKQPSLVESADNLGIKDEVVFTGLVPHAEVPHFIAAANIGVSPVPPLPYYQVSSPIKMFEYMAMGKPVVANEEILEHKEVLTQSDGGILVSYTAEAFAAAIIRLLNAPEIAAKMGQKGQEWVTKNRSYEVLARRIEKKFLQLLDVNYHGSSQLP